MRAIRPIDYQTTASRRTAGWLFHLLWIAAVNLLGMCALLALDIIHVLITPAGRRHYMPTAVEVHRENIAPEVAMAFVFFGAAAVLAILAIRRLNRRRFAD